MKERQGRRRRKAVKTEPDQLQDVETDADGDANASENFDGSNVAVSQSSVLDEETRLSCDEVEDDESNYFYEAPAQHGRRKTEKAETGKQRSAVWKYFVSQRSSALCQICKKSVKRSSGNTTSLIQHLNRTHHKQYADMMAESSRRKMERATQHMVLCVTVHT